MNQFNAKTVEMVENQFAVAIEGTIALFAAILAIIAPKRTERAGDKRQQLPTNDIPLPYVPVLLGKDDIVSYGAPENFNRDGYPIDETTFAGSGLPYTVPAQPVKPRKPARQAAQTVERETPAVQPVKPVRKPSKPVPALPPAPTERKELQALAKANGIKANGKSADIIAQLREKGIVS